METLYLIVGLTLTYLFAIEPIYTATRKKQKRKFWSYYRHFQLQEIQKHYPELEHLTLNEIRERYNVTEAYNRLS